MDLHADKLFNDIISLAHNGIQKGDVMDPDMQIQIYPASKSAEALTFQNDYIGLYQEVYHKPKHIPKLKRELNQFNEWLKNMIEQEYALVEQE